jgi:hypothetical protein
MQFPALFLQPMSPGVVPLVLQMGGGLGNKQFWGSNCFGGDEKTKIFPYGASVSKSCHGDMESGS